MRVEVDVTSEVTISWLDEGVRLGVCPLCRVGHERDQTFIERFCEDLECHGTLVPDFIAARGFCGEHARWFERLAAGRLRSATARLYLAALERLASDLADLEPDRWLCRAACPACVDRDRGIADAARQLMSELGRSGPVREAFRRSRGLCLGHFTLAWDVSAEDDDRDLLRDVQRAVTSRLADEVRNQLCVDSGEVGAISERSGTEAWRRAESVMSG